MAPASAGTLTSKSRLKRQAAADQGFFLRFPVNPAEFFKRQHGNMAALLQLGADLAVREIVDLRVRHQSEFSAIQQPASRGRAARIRWEEVFLK